MALRRANASKFFTSSSSVMAMLAAGAMLTPTAAFALDANALPENGVVVGGGATFDYSTPNNLNVNQSTDRVVINWDGFNIGADAATRFIQPGSNSLAVNRVLSKGTDPTQILGRLSANGKIVVLDRNGVIFGKDSVVDAGGIIASTGDIGTDQVMSGADRLDIGNLGEGEIVNNGLITVADAGLAGFVGKTAVNNGIIKAKLGRVSLASGEKATVDLYGDGLVEIAADSNLTKAIASNTGTIHAEGGTVRITASAAKNAVDNVVNMSGIVDVSSVQVVGGKIILGGNGTTKVTGALKASGKSGGRIDVKGQNVLVADTATLNADATRQGNGGTVNVIAQDHADYRGSISARGGSESGDGGTSEVSGYGVLGYDGSVDLTAANGATGALLLDPAFAVIHSGSYPNALGGGFVITAQSLANTMKTAIATLTATNFIDVGTRIGPYNTGNAVIDNALNFLIGTGPINLGTYTNGGTGATTNGLTLTAATVNFNKDVTMGTAGILNANAGTVNLNSKIYGYTGTLLGDARLNTSASNVNVVSNNASIQQGVDFASAGQTVNVGNGAYNENVVIDKALTLQSVNGRDVTTINGISNAGALGTVRIAGGVNNVNLGTTGKGFTINGIDNGNPAVENAAVYLQGAHDNISVKANRIVAAGDEALTTEYGSVNSNMTVDGNIITGTTYTGAPTLGGDQFVDANVARQLVAFNLGLAGLIFTNNSILGNSGEQHLVAIESDVANISGNVFDGSTTASALRLRGSNLTVSNNAIDGNGTANAGINVSNATGVNIFNANKIDATDDGLRSVNTTSTISNNEIGLIAALTGNGIFTTGGDNTQILANKVANTTKDGIKIEGGNAVQIRAGNQVANAGRVGIYAANATNLLIDGNSVAGATFGIGSAYGAITTDFGSNLTISNNTVSDSTHGVRMFLAGGTENFIMGNALDDLANDGVYVTDLSSVEISDNKIGYGVDGLYGTDDTTVGGNGVTLIDSASALIDGNQIAHTAGKGVFVDPSPGTVVSGNTIDNTGTNGIHILSSDNSAATGNFVGTLGGADNIGGDGILIELSNATQVSANTVSNTKTTGFDIGSGVHILNSNNATVNNNVISATDWDGVKLTSGNNAVVRDNDITNVGRAGIYSRFAPVVTVTSNDITGTGLEGIIFVNSTGAGNVSVTANTLDSIGTDGIRLNSTDDGIVSGNIIGYGADGLFGTADDTATGQDGICLAGTSNAQILGNSVTGAARNGIYASLGRASVTGNAITGNTVNNTGSTGIYLNRSNASTVSGNFVGTLGAAGNIGADGVLVELSNGAQVTGNAIANTETPAMDVGSGVHILTGNNAVVTNNTISNTGWDGVKLTTGNNALVQGNVITDVGRAGVYSKFAPVVTVTANNITGTGLEGIIFVNSTGAGNVSVTGNTLNSIGNDGIRLNSTDDAIVSGNTIGYGADGVFGTADDTTTGRDGIRLAGTSNAQIVNNLVTGAMRHGIYASLGGASVTGNAVTGNTVNNTGNAGIYLNDSDATTVSGNFVGTLGALNSIGGDGILVELSDNATVTGNAIANTETTGFDIGSGVHILNSNAAVVTGNTTLNTGWDGIKLTTGNNALVQNNIITNAGRAGIYSRFSPVVTVSGNTITGTGLEGIMFVNSTGAGNVSATGNTLNSIGTDGIRLNSTDDGIVSGNTIGYGVDGILGTADDTTTGQDGIRLAGTSNAQILNNLVTGAARNGIYASLGGSSVTGNAITGNTVNNAGNYGVYLNRSNDTAVTGNAIGTLGLAGNIGADGVRAELSSGTTVSNNVIANADLYGVRMLNVSGVTLIDSNEINAIGLTGIAVDGATDLRIQNNMIGLGADQVAGTVDDTTIGQDGIFAANSLLTQILSNMAANAARAGVYVQNMGAAVTTIADNEIANSDTGMYFESGTVDLTGLTNTLTNGRVGYHFEPLPGNSVNLAGDTIGSTIFVNQSEYYVELAGGAMFAPGTPTVIDGLGASYDGYLPNDDGISMSQGQFDSIESRIYHFTDDTTLGLFFFGSVPSALIDQSDIFRDINGVPGVAGRFSITIRGLPRIAGLTTPAAPTVNASGFSLNDITPAAGGDATDGTTNATGATLDQITPQAGGDSATTASTTCWSDAIAAASTGQVVTYGFNGDGSDAIAAQSSCRS